MGSVWVREWRAVVRNRSAIINPVAFVFLGVLLFNLGSRSYEESFDGSALGMLWVLVLIANLLALDSTFRRDFESGLLEQIFVSAEVPFLILFLKVLMQWMTTGFLISLLSPLLALLMGVPYELLGNTFVALLIGTPTLSFLGAIGASLTVGMGRGGALLALLVLPLYIPVLIFGVDVSQSESIALTEISSLYWLFFISLASLTLAPFAILLGLKISLAMD
jgi:heme exporter protein B|tara:strand:- start:157 stop:819 length:663 start_codon:yes stop_codon:yes gene_type:complete